MKLLFAPLAEGDLKEIWHYLATECANMQAAEKQTRRLFACFERLLAYQLVGRARDDLSSGLRYFPVDQYVVFYRLDAQAEIVEIARILHSKRDVAVFFE